MSKNYSTDIASAISDYLTSDDWHFMFDEENGIFKFHLRGKGKLRNLRYKIYVRNDGYVVNADTDAAQADEDNEKMMAAMAEFLHRANYGLFSGNFEFDHRDGEVCYKCAVLCDDIVPSAKMIKHSIVVPAKMFERYGDGIVNIIYNDATAKEAIRQCEGEISDVLEELLSDGAAADEKLAARLMARLMATMDSADDDDDDEEESEDDEA